MMADHAPSQGRPDLDQSFPKVDVHSGELHLSRPSPKFGWLPDRSMWGGKMVQTELHDYLRVLETLMPPCDYFEFYLGKLTASEGGHFLDL